MFANIENAKFNVHVVALIVTALGVVVSTFGGDPVVQAWISMHWWANDLVHSAVVAIPPILVYYGISSKPQLPPV